MNTGGVSPVPWLPNQLLAAGTSKRGIENPDTGWFYPRATMEEKREAPMPFPARPYRRFPVQCFRSVCLHATPVHSAWRAAGRG